MTLAQLVTIKWRDIPAQVLAKEGRTAERRVLPGRFQDAIDRAATRAGLTADDDYLAEWRRESRQCGNDLAAEVMAEEARLLDRYGDEALAALVQSGGVAP